MSKDGCIKRIEGVMGLDFSDEQVDIIKHGGNPLNVISCAGSGKTTLMIAKLCYMQMVQKVNPASIIVISFNRSAVEEIEERYWRISEELGLSKRVTFKTFHALYLMILKYYADKITEDGELNVISQRKASSLYNRAFYEMSKDKSDDVKENIITLRSYALNNMIKTRNQLVNTPKFITSDIDAEDYFNVIKRYRDLKKEGSWVDFEDLQVLMLKLMLKNEEARARVRGAWDYWFIDEYQDICKIQMEILNLTVSDPDKLVTIGDEDQCIYEFRGSKVDYIVDFPVFFKNAARKTISYNYRCPSVILGRAVNTIENNEKRTEKKMKASVDGGRVVYTGYKSPLGASLDIARGIYEDFISGKDLSEIAILYRTSYQQLFVVDRLIDLGVPIKVRKKSNLLYNHLVVRDIRNIIDLALNEEDPYVFQKVFTKITRYVTKSEVNYVTQEMVKNGGSWKDYIGWENDSVMLASNVLDEIKEMVNKKDKMSEIIPVVMRVYREFLRFAKEIDKMSQEDIEDVIDYLIYIGEDKSYKKFLYYLERSKSVVELFEDSDEAVTITTMHTVKGLEFDDVYILDASDKIIPCGGRVEKIVDMFGMDKAREYIEQERRLMYVACTRAKEKLHITYTIGDHSRFIEEQVGEDKIEDLRKGREIEFR